MEKSWFERVEDYLNDLELMVTAIEDNLSRATVETRGLDIPEVRAKQVELSELVGLLESKVADRALLLAAPDAPAAGCNLSEKSWWIRTLGVRWLPNAVNLLSRRSPTSINKPSRFSYVNSNFLSSVATLFVF